MSDLEERALRAVQQEQAEKRRKHVAELQAKAESDERLRVQLATTAVARVDSVLGVRTSPSDWKLHWATTRNGYGDDEYPTVGTEIDGILVNWPGNGHGQLVCNAGGSGRYFEFSLVGFGQALQFKKDETLVKCRHCGQWIAGKKMAAHEEDCYRHLPWHKKVLGR
jgi:hypothetical protein